MRATVGAIRVLAVLFGLFCLASAALDVLGLLPHSTATPPPARRAAHALPLAAIGVALALPYRMIRSRRSPVALASLLCLVVGWLAYRSADGVLDYVTARRSWHVVPAAIALLAMAGANLWAFLRITRRSPPGSASLRAYDSRV